MPSPHPTPHTPHPPRWLHRYAVLLVIATFVLVASGGNVTSRDAGLAVPDGFTVYGYFLWTFPLEMWRGNIFHEHIHRLKGSVIGLMSIVLAVWMWAVYRRAAFAGNDWRRWLGVVALVLVIVQGVMGGLRVEFADWFPRLEIPFRIAHAVTGQMFLCLTVIVAVVTSRLWHDRVMTPNAHSLREVGRPVRAACLALLAVLLLQLVLGASMRHTRSGLAIPDFPASYGSIAPPLSQQGIITAMDDYAVSYDDASHYYTPMQVMLAFGHRTWAAAVLIAAAVVLSYAGPIAREDAAVRAPLLVLAMLLIVQVALGAAAIWTRLHPDVATAHQATGAATLATAVWLTLRVHLARVKHTALPDAPLTLAGGVPV